MEYLVACTIALQGFFTGASVPVWEDRLVEHYTPRMATCLDVASVARAEGVPMSLAVAVAWEESKFYERAKSRAGAHGPMQVLPKYHCPSGTLKGCDLVLSGVLTLKKYLKKYNGGQKGILDALCHYNAGNVCGRRSKQYANRVYRLNWRIEAALYVIGNEFPCLDPIIGTETHNELP